ncbi:N-(5'-phosphoribosyl)anthranilate isomerase [uncultured Limimaricola sp.]|uniref:N-(5'-phosphoribosyl)anthranilate isomerase n=1 Tax=uncultured Limimaricola sp. TaxID=2211667 RepID=UPI0030F7C710
MTTPPAVISPERWLCQLFASQAAASGGIVRRGLRDVDRIVGRTRFVHEIKWRGFRAIENAGQVVIFCNHNPVRPLC